MSQSEEIRECLGNIYCDVLKRMISAIEDQATLLPEEHIKAVAEEKAYHVVLRILISYMEE